MLFRSSKQAYSSAKGWRNFKNISSEGTHGIEGIGTDSADSDSSVNLFDTNGRKLYSGPLSGINVSEHGIYVIQKGNSTFKIRL